MRSGIVTAIAPLFLLATGCAAAQAKVVEEVQYSMFAQLGGNATASAQILVPNFVTANLDVSPAQLQFCEIVATPCAGVSLLPDNTALSLTAEDVISIVTVGPIGLLMIGAGFLGLWRRTLVAI
jgi:hypothetical protein